MIYTIYYRRPYSFSRKIKGVLSHHYDSGTDKLTVFTETGAYEIPGWSKCSCRLGSDWKAMFNKIQQEKQV
jgi:hypothetical protein